MGVERILDTVIKSAQSFSRRSSNCCHIVLISFKPHVKMTVLNLVVSLCHFCENAVRFCLDTHFNVKQIRYEHLYVPDLSE